MKSYFLYERLLFLAEQQEHWKDTKTLVKKLSQAGFINAKNPGCKDRIITVRNHIRFLGKLKGIFLKSRKTQASVA